MAFTYFFRDASSLELSVELLKQETMGRARIKVWDAGCANGSEPFTLTILMAEAMGRFAFRNVLVTATDINPNFKNNIENGVYHYDELKRIPPEIFDKYFYKTNKKTEFKLVEKIREKVKFINHDLTLGDKVDSEFSLIVCKNVLLHFSPEKRLEVIKMFWDSLCDKGLLIMERTQMMPSEFEGRFERVTSNARLYQKKG